MDGGRLRPDGQRVQWQTGRQKTFDLPFLCGDVTPRELRVPTGEVRRHANGALGIATLAVAVHDLEVSLARYSALLGIGGEGAVVHVGAPVVLPGLGIRIAAIGLGTTAIVLMAPSGITAVGGGAMAASELSERLAMRGEGPCAMALRAADGQEVRTLDGVLSHRATMDIGDWRGVGSIE
jgi:hypothetical protein